MEKNFSNQERPTFQMRQVLQFFPVAKPIKSHVDKLRLFPFQSKKNSFHVNFCQRGLRKIPNGIDSLYTVSSNTRKLSNQFSHLTSRGFGWKWYCESYLTTTKVKWLKMVSPTLKCCMGFIVARQNQIHLLTTSYMIFGFFRTWNKILSPQKST